MSRAAQRQADEAKRRIAWEGAMNQQQRITREDIEQLMAEALSGGEAALVATCRRALRLDERRDHLGTPVQLIGPEAREARRECKRAILVRRQRGGER
jgi:uncharacterized protein YoaH (UPF0181 family)